MFEKEKLIFVSWNLEMTPFIIYFYYKIPKNTQNKSDGSDANKWTKLIRTKWTGSFPRCGRTLLHRPKYLMGQL